MQEAVLGIVTANPCRGVTADVVKRHPRQMQFLTPGEVAQLADAIDPDYRTLVNVAARPPDPVSL